MKKTKRYGSYILLLLLFFVMEPWCVRAAETDASEAVQFQAGTVWEIVSDTELKKEPDRDADTWKVFLAGTAVLLLEDEQGGWVLVQNQSDTGYVPVDALQIFGEENLDAMNQEFAQTEQTQMRVVEEHELAEKEQGSSAIWKILIILLIAALFGMGIYDAFTKNKKK